MSILGPWRGRVIAAGDTPASVASLPNLISIARLLLTPVFVWMILANPEPGLWRTIATAVFIVLISTDFVDGYLARSRNLVTDFGKLIDPIADKVITGSGFVVLSILGELPWWITMLVLVRELGITVYRLAVSTSSVIAADWAGKAKTVAQSIAIPAALLPLQAWLGDWAVWACVVSMTVAVLLTVYSGLEFAWHQRRSR